MYTFVVFALITGRLCVFYFASSPYRSLRSHLQLLQRPGYCRRREERERGRMFLSNYYWIIIEESPALTLQI